MGKAGDSHQPGLPHPSLFPLREAKFNCLEPAAPLPSDAPGEAAAAETDILSLTLGRGASPGDLDLTQFLQYGELWKLIIPTSPQVNEC
jgi:aromatic amino acid aminotransferase I